jgi:PTS system arbutin-like IIC component
VPQIRERFEALMQAPDSNPVAVASGTDKSVGMAAVVSGRVLDITAAKDEMFSQKMMGDGVAIEPSSDTIVAPAAGEVTMVMQDSLHAVGMRFSNGVELLIHVGIDTVKLNGEGFTLLTEQGAKVTAGTPLLKFDKQKIKAAGYDPTVMMVITNSAEYPLLKKQTGKTAEAGQTTVMTF